MERQAISYREATVEIHEELDNLIGAIARKNRGLLSKAFGLSRDALVQKIIWQLSMSGAQSSKELTTALKVSKSSISAAINCLIEAGIVERLTKETYGSEPLQIRYEYRELIESHRLQVIKLIQKSYDSIEVKRKIALSEELKEILKRVENLAQELENMPLNFIFKKHHVHKNYASSSNTVGMIHTSEKQDNEDKNLSCRQQIEHNTNCVIIERQTRIIRETFEKKTEFK